MVVEANALKISRCVVLTGPYRMSLFLLIAYNCGVCSQKYKNNNLEVLSSSETIAGHAICWRWPQKLAKKRTGKSVTSGTPDRDEATSAMEPMLISESSRHRGRL
jgi:hypothetical protein